MARPRRWLALLLVGALMLAQPRPSRADADWPRLVGEPVVGGLTHPTVLVDPGDGSGRLLAPEKSESCGSCAAARPAPA